MKVSELSGALLDYWTARAEGVPAGELEIRLAAVRPGDPRSPDEFCVRRIGHLTPLCIDYSTNWAMTGPLVEKLRIDITDEGIHPDHSPWSAFCFGPKANSRSSGETALIAICRAVVRAAFGDEVEELEEK